MKFNIKIHNDDDLNNGYAEEFRALCEHYGFAIIDAEYDSYIDHRNLPVIDILRIDTLEQIAQDFQATVHVDFFTRTIFICNSAMKRYRKIGERN